MIDVARGGFLSDNDRSVLDRFPVEIAAEDLIRCFSLGERDLELVWDRVGPGARLVGGLQIGALRLLGFVPGDVMSAPSRVVEFVGSQVRATASDLAGYTTRRPTRWEHISAVERHVGFRRAGAVELKGLDGWLEEQALEHDRPVTLFAMACDHLMAEGVVRLGVTTIERAVVSARGRAWTETFRRLEPQLTSERRRNLDGLLAVDPDRAMSPLAWFRRLPAGRSSAQIRELVQVKQQLIDVGADCFDVSMLNLNRVRHLAALGRRMDAQALARMAPERRYPILVATAVERLIATSDLVLDLFDTAVGAIDRKARRDRDEQTKAHVVAASDTGIRGTSNRFVRSRKRELTTSGRMCSASDWSVKTGSSASSRPSPRAMRSAWSRARCFRIAEIESGSSFIVRRPERVFGGTKSCPLSPATSALSIRSRLKSSVKSPHLRPQSSPRRAPISPGRDGSSALTCAYRAPAQGAR